MIQEVQQTLKKYFGYSSFKKGQEKIITSILNKKDTFGIMPTGGGKSICYQIPALMLPGITLVISPLISLMKDQVDALDNLGISSAYINSSLDQREVENRIFYASRGKYKLLYIAPERLESERFQALLNNMPISLLAVDEAHCISQWGHDFRPSYLSIINLINELPCRPIIAAFTATATEEVKKDIVNLLSLKTPDVYVTGFNRENLSFSVIKGGKKTDFVTEYLDAHRNQSGIIYAATRKEVDRLYEYLIKKGYSAGKYHAGMSDTERNQSQEAFIYENVQIMIATNAFGMGIDKSNVRYVIHLNMPKNMEAYYQEAGRAGRDGDPAECILLFGASDIHIQKFLIEQTLLSPERKSNEYKKLKVMVDYCHTTQCLRKYILEYFGEEEIPQNCGNCGNCNDDSELSDITEEAQKIFSCIRRMREQYGVSLVANVLKGSNTKKVHQLGFDSLSTYGIMKEYTIGEISNLVNLLIAEDYLHVTEGQYPIVRLQEKAIRVIRNEEKVMQKVRKKKQEETPDLTLFELLRSLRKQISEKENVPPYVIFHDRTLHEMCRYLPADSRSMLAIAGVGENKLRKYGDQFMEVIRKYMNEHEISPVRLELAPAAQNEQKTPSHIITYEMYKEGKSPKDISRERSLTLITIEDHLIRCGQEGYYIDWDSFIPLKYEDLILQKIKELGPGKLKPLKESLPDEIDYFSIKAVLCKHVSSL